MLNISGRDIAAKNQVICNAMNGSPSPFSRGNLSAADSQLNSSSEILPSLFTSILPKRVSMESLFFAVAVAANSA